MEILHVNLRQNGKVGGYNNPNKIIIHHPEFNGSIERLNDIMIDMGFAMIGYNYYVRKDGTVYKGRPDNVTSGNCYGQNNQSLGVCFEGDYDKETSMPTAQFNAGVWLIKKLMNDYGIKEVNGHKKYYNTECPGKYFPLARMLDAIKTYSGTSGKPTPTVPESTSKKLWEVSIQGEEVKALQRVLVNEFKARIDVDGYFGEATLKACPLVVEGNKGNIVKLVQQRLLNRGYDSLKASGGADGIFGKGTTKAVQNLQKNKSLVIDGKVGQNTWKALYSK